MLAEKQRKYWRNSTCQIVFLFCVWFILLFERICVCFYNTTSEALNVFCRSICVELSIVLHTHQPSKQRTHKSKEKETDTHQQFTYSNRVLSDFILHSSVTTINNLTFYRWLCVRGIFSSLDLFISIGNVYS